MAESLQQQQVYLSVSSMAQRSLAFSLTATAVPDFELQYDVPRHMTVAAARPRYQLFRFPDGVESVLLKVTSDPRQCMTVSVQQVKCPVFDLDNNVNYEGKHQTMSSQAAMILERADYKSGSLYVVLITHPDPVACDGYMRLRPLSPAGSPAGAVKNVTVTLKPTIPASQYQLAVTLTLALFAAFYVMAAIIGCCFKGCNLRRDLGDLTDQERDNQALLVESITTSQSGLIGRPGSRPASYGATSAPGGPLVSPLSPGGPSVSSLDSSVASNPTQPWGQGHNPDDEGDIDFLTDADSEKEVFRTKRALFVSDLARKKRTKLSKTYKLYHWNLLTIAIFYGLPVAQLVLTYQKVLQQTGNQDLCYYNFACAHPLAGLSAFNNVFSNLGYVLLGLLFIIIVYFRSLNHHAVVTQHNWLEGKVGIPQHFGLYYAMGLALLMEGIMSGCYHICPNYSNFQFDTSFMYIIACLCMLKIYQSRHPDINAKAHLAFFIMAVIIFLAVVGVVYGTAPLWIVYACVHVLLTVVLTMQIYYVGRWKIDRFIFKRMFHIAVSDWRTFGKPIYPNRFVLLLIGNLVNWAFAIYGAVSKPSDFATYLLAVFIGNLLFYCFFYIIMKLLSGERLSWLVLVIMTTSMVTWSGALYFFFQHLTSWQKTPAGSREGNRECLVLDFYDSHDIWHFLSAISLFFCFLILLVLDDDVSLKRRDQIPVF